MSKDAEREQVQINGDSGAKWPTLAQLRLSEREIERRRGYIGGSDANVILSGDAQRVRELWLEKRGEKTPENLEDKLSVMLGCWTESFNRFWFERVSGQAVSRLGEVCCCPHHDWRRCSLDGFVEASDAVWEAKHTSAFAKPEEVLDRYMPQLQHNMAVVGAPRAVMCVIFGNHKYEIIEIAADWLYQMDLLKAEEDFWECIQSGREPVPAVVPPTPRPIGTREVCLEGSNAWAMAAADWLENRDAAKAFSAAVAQIKELIEDDVGRAFGHGIDAKRSKSGAITIRELKL